MVKLTMAFRVAVFLVFIISGILCDESQHSSESCEDCSESEEFDYDPDCDVTLSVGGEEVYQGVAVRVVQGDDVAIQCTAYCTGSGVSPGFFWKKDGQSLSHSIGRVHYITTTYDRRSVLHVNNMMRKDEGHYSCTGWIKGIGYMSKQFNLVLGCSPGTEACDSHRCIDASKVCDGVSDCQDGTDEMFCLKCSDNQYKCDGMCMDNSTRCDMINDCSDGRDEEGCENEEVSCHANEFQCDNGGCVDKSYKCDGYVDCADESDEARCPCVGWGCDEVPNVVDDVTLTITTESPPPPPSLTTKTPRPSPKPVKPKRTTESTVTAPPAPPKTTPKADAVHFDYDPNCQLSLFLTGDVIYEGTDVRVNVGQYVDISCLALCTGSGITPSLTWKKDDVRMSDNVGRVYTFSTTSERRSVLRIQRVLRSDFAYYTCTGWIKGIGYQSKSFNLVQGCKPGYAECDGHRCLNESRVCDGVTDCEDETDELYCKECTPDQFMCDGQCFSNTKLCDDIWDCSDGLDEHNCEETCEFSCDNGHVCLTQESVCDGIPQCQDETDENLCDSDICETFSCDGGELCLSNDLVCDGTPQCEDGTDEACDDQHTYEMCDFSCDEDQVCLTHDSVCDGIAQCQDETDEDWCDPTATVCDTFSCDGGEMCLSNDLVCDGIPQCEDGTDEACEDHQYTLDTCAFSCDDGDVCLTQESVCDGIPQCQDKTDENLCDTEEPIIENTVDETDAWKNEFDPVHGDLSEFELEQNETEQEYDKIEMEHEGSHEKEIYDIESDGEEDTDEEIAGSSPCVMAIIKDGEELEHNSDVEIGLGQSTAITCSAFCSIDVPKITLSWVKDENVIESKQGRIHLFVGTDKDFHKLRITDAEESDLGRYTCNGWVMSEIPFLIQKSVRITNGHLSFCDEEHFQCKDGTCIDKGSVCDNNPDCNGKEDEDGKLCKGQRVCPTGQLPCDDNNYCFSTLQMCDGNRDCRDGRDEINCVPINR